MDPLLIEKLTKRTNINSKDPFIDSVFRAELDKLDERYSILSYAFKQIEEDKNKLLRYVNNRKLKLPPC